MSGPTIDQHSHFVTLKNSLNKKGMILSVVVNEVFYLTNLLLGPIHVLTWS